jgi:cytochrome c biogenesis protein CcmG/thiol:disulfide interchange protein DsbE
VVPTEELEGFRKPARRRAALALVVAAAVAGIVYLAARPAEEKPVPDFRLPLLNGGTMSSDDLRGSPIVMNFFASWCPPCRDEAPVLEDAYHRYRDDGVRFVGVDVQDTASDARRFVRDFGISFPVVRDAERTLARALGVYGLPQTFFIDRDYNLLGVRAGERLGASGEGRPVQLGAISRSELAARIEDLLEENG